MIKLEYPKEYKGLKLKHISQAAEDALSDINVERQGEQLGLFCDWKSVNKAMGKYWRFNHITQLAAPSGHGKSFTINQLHSHFTDLTDIMNNDGKSVFHHAINKSFKKEVVVVHFGLEMDASDEVIRSISRMIGKSHNYILSSQWDDETNNYNTLTDAEFNKIQNRMNFLRTKPIYYVEMTGTTPAMYWTVALIRARHPNALLVISIDHGLLVKRGATERSDADLIAAVASLALRFRKEFKAMVIILSQLNNNIKSSERINTPALHYPLDSDIYWGSQINWVCDNIWIFPYRPELFNIREYGLDKVDTDGLVVASCIKSRKGSVGEVFFNEHLAQGKFSERTVTLS